MSKTSPYLVVWFKRNPDEFPDDENLDCEDFDSELDALRFYTQFNGAAWVVLHTPEGEFVRQTSYKPDTSWRNEQAMQAGMMGGCRAYNEVLGGCDPYDEVEDYDDGGPFNASYWND